MPQNDEGFTLIETLVALVAFVLMVMALLQCLSGGLAAVRTVDRDDHALVLVKGMLAEAGVTGPLVEGTQSGESGNGVSWSLDVKRVSAANMPSPPSGTLAGYWVTAAASWRNGPLQRTRSVSLTTVKLGRVP